MTTPLTNAFPIVSTDGVTGKDTDRDFRKGLLAAMLLPDVKTSNPLAVRNGILPHSWDSNGCTSLRPQQQSTASTSVDVLAGTVVCERTGQGPYLGWSEATVSVPLPSADASNPRYDTIYAHVGDQVNINTDSWHGAVVGFVSGTAQATPVIPADSALPDGAVRLANINRPSLAVRASGVVQSTDITDMRKSTGYIGSARHMLPGDSLTDPGKLDGEQRVRTAAAPLPELTDWWDAAQSKWRGGTAFRVTGVYPGTPDANQNVSASISGGGNTLITVNVPDPGYPYMLRASSLFKINSISSPTTVNYYASANYGPFAGCIATIGNTVPCPVIANGGDIFTGASTVRLIIDVLGGGSVTWGADVRNKLTIEVVPA